MEILDIQIIKETSTVVKFEVVYKNWLGKSKSKSFMITNLTSADHCLHDHKGNVLYGSSYLDKIILYVQLNNLRAIAKFTHIIK